MAYNSYGPILGSGLKLISMLVSPALATNKSSVPKRVQKSFFRILDTNEHNVLLGKAVKQSNCDTVAYGRACYGIRMIRITQLNLRAILQQFYI